MTSCPECQKPLNMTGEYSKIERVFHCGECNCDFVIKKIGPPFKDPPKNK